MYINGFQQKEFQNCYELFESNFIFIIRDSLREIGSLEIESLKPFKSTIDYFEKNGTFEQKFENLIDEILFAFENRTKYLRDELKIDFIENQNNFFNELYPDLREAILFHNFVCDLNNDYMYNEERDLPLFNYSFKIYLDYYLTLKDCIDCEYNNYIADIKQASVTDVIVNQINVINNNLFEELRTYLVNESDFDSIVNRVNAYFTNDSPITGNPVRMKRAHKKKICKIMGELWKFYKNEAITFDYLLYYPNLFDCIKFEEIDSTRGLAESNIYKYSMGN